MPTKQLEIRGIHRQNIIDYIYQLHGKEKKPNHYQGPTWTCTVSKEKTIRFFQSDIPVVFVTFWSGDKDVLETILKQFRLKTFRAGG
ncbi:hypothetical protein [Alkalihalobacillus sp. LMS39]|uniref:hypothetical protein n=1 Tax=Alkalihalobacillus sp. LMS39 TaxID=2924032 RepID=UPI001FB23194|nr:hypothetical protein [Alkalihalobacillus sp. LMS39]UOE92182.1 hypothetical protein MM271_13020 [Alkalihalobacillus sp. LMS39]